MLEVTEIIQLVVYYKFILICFYSNIIYIQ